MTAKNKSDEIKITRIYDAPVRAVWDAWADPKRAAQWWGPRGFTLTHHSKDLRAGGTWHYTMHSPDGVDYINKTHYFEVEEFSRLVYDHGGNDDRRPLFHVTVQFKDLQGKTEIEMAMKFPTLEAMETTRIFIKKAGGDATWDRLAEYLAKETSGKEIFVINRTFDAPPDAVFERWANPKHFSRWLAPKGFEMEFIKADIKPGGSTFYCMTNGAGTKMYGKAEYQEIEHPRRMVYTQQFCDENGKVSRHPFAPTWPETMLTRVTFAEEAPGKTRVTVTWEVYGKAVSEELETFMKSKAGMTQGWTGSFDKLEAYLSESVPA